MRKKFQFLVSYTSLVLNLSYLGLWMYVFNRFDTHEVRVAFFQHFIYLPTPIPSLLLMVLSLFSMVVFARSPRYIDKLPMLIQIGVTLLLIWQFL